MRPFDESDSHFSFALFKEIVAPEFALSGLPAENLEPLLRQQFEIRQSQWCERFPDAERSIILDGSTPVGEWFVAEDGPFSTLVNIALSESVRGRGIAGVLVRQLCEHAGREAKPVRAHVHKDNPARAIWLHQGFEVVEDKGVYDRLEYSPRRSRCGSPPDGFSLRLVKSGDDDFLLKLFKLARARTFGVIELPQQQLDELMAQQFKAFHVQVMKQYPRAEHFLIIRRGEPIGEWHLDEDDERIYIVNAALLPDFQGKGISAALHRSLFARADCDGKPVRSHVEKGNPAQEILAHLGLEIVGDSGPYYELEYRGNSTA